MSSTVASPSAKVRLDPSKPLWRTFIVFLMPMMATNALQLMSGALNGVVIGRMLGVHALSAMAGFFPILFLLISFVIGLGSGASVLIGQAYGANELVRVKAVAGTTLTVSDRHRHPDRDLRRPVRAQHAGAARYTAGRSGGRDAICEHLPLFRADPLRLHHLHDHHARRWRCAHAISGAARAECRRHRDDDCADQGMGGPTEDGCGQRSLCHDLLVPVHRAVDGGLSVMETAPRWRPIGCCSSK